MSDDHHVTEVLMARAKAATSKAKKTTKKPAKKMAYIAGLPKPKGCV